jgi:hypothetical protein
MRGSAVERLSPDDTGATTQPAQIPACHEAEEGSIAVLGAPGSLVGSARYDNQ